MLYRTLGKTGLKVSVLGFGGAPAGLQDYLVPGDRNDPDFQRQVGTAIREALALGVNFFDTAPGYGGGISERIFGEALAGAGKRAVLATKYGFYPGAGKQDLTRELEASLARLRVERVDILQLHGTRFDDAQADDILASGVLDWADEMRASGRCRFTGITAEMPSGALERLLRSGRFDVLQMVYSLVLQTPCDYSRGPAGVIPLAKSLGMGVLSSRSATSGLLHKLMRKEFPDIDSAKLTRLALNYALSTPEVDCVLVGMVSSEEVRQNVALAADEKSRYDLADLHERYLNR